MDRVGLRRRRRRRDDHSGANEEAGRGIGRLDVAGCEPKSAPLQTFADIIKSDVAVWAKVVKEAGITSD
jgi:hypothetical protein